MLQLFLSLSITVFRMVVTTAVDDCLQPQANEPIVDWHYECGPDDIPILMLEGSRPIPRSNKKIGNLLSFNSTMLIGCENVTTFHLSGTYIRTLPPRAFAGLPHLQRLDLSSNCLFRIAANTFEGLKKLTMLRLDANRIGCSFLHNAFNCEAASQNAASQTPFDREAFAGLGQLQRLNLGDNWLSSIEGQPFSSLGRSLQLLNLNNNNILVIPTDAFANLSAVSELKLGGNNIDTIYDGAPVFLLLKALESIDLSYNRLPGLDNSWLRFDNTANKSLSLNLEGNYIAYIAHGTFDSFRGRLKDLNMRVNPSSCVLSKLTGEIRCKCLTTSHPTAGGAPQNTPWPGGEQGYCICPRGQYLLSFIEYANSSESSAKFCVQCSVGTYNSDGQATSCTRCSTGYTEGVGRSSESECVESPEVRDAKDRADRREVLVAGVGTAAFFSFLAVGMGIICTMRQRKQAVEAELVQLQLVNKEKEIDYLRNWYIRSEEITLGELVAEGGEGLVYKGSLRGYDKTVAIKVAIMLDPETNQHVWDEREVFFLMHMQHDRLVKMLGAGEMTTPSSQETIFVVQEYMSGGSLNGRLWGTPLSSVTWRERLQWAADIAEAMVYLHTKGFTHRDLKTPNALYDIATCRAKVADFGMTRSLAQTKAKATYKRCIRNSNESHDSAAMTANCGTPQWMAPELCVNAVKISDKWREVQEAMLYNVMDSEERDALNEEARFFQRKHSQMEYTTAVDIFAFGIVMLELLSHEAPWHDAKRDVVLREVASGSRPPYDHQLEGDAVDGWCTLMRQCWHQKPGLRPSFTEILSKMSRMLQNHDAMNTAAQDALNQSYGRLSTFSLPNIRPDTGVKEQSFDSAQTYSQALLHTR